MNMYGGHVDHVAWTVCFQPRKLYALLNLYGQQVNNWPGGNNTEMHNGFNYTRLF